MGQFGFFDADRRLAAITAKGDPLEMIARVVPFERFRLAPRTPGPPRHRRDGVGPGGAVGAMLAAIVMAGAARDVRGGESPSGGYKFPPADRLRRVIT